MRVVFFLLFLTLTFSFAASKRVLILNSYHKGYELSDTIIKNIEDVFYSYEDIDVNILYMDSKQINSRDYIRQLSDLYALQLQHRRYDLIIAIDRFAYKFAVKNYNNVFHDEPILFTGVEQFDKELVRIYGMDKKVNGIIQKMAIEDNLRLIFRMMPDIKKLYILNDRSENGNDSSPFITKAINKIKLRVQVEYLRDDTLKEFKEYFSTYKEGEAILFVHYSNDSNGDYYRTNEVAFAINEFKLPVFVTDSLFMNKGALGGKLVPIEELGKKTGHKAIALLHKKIKTPDITVYDDYKYVFDANKLSKFNLTLPKGLKEHEVINGPVGFFDKYRTLINTVFLASPVLLVVIFGLIQALYEKQKYSRKLRHRVEFDKVLLNSIDSPIFWQNKDGKVLDANAKFCELIGLSYGTLIGNTLNHFYHNFYYARQIIHYLERLEEGELEESQMILYDKNGDKKIYFINQTSYESDSYASGMVTIFTDITKEKEEEIRKVKDNQYMIQQTKLAEIGEIFSSIAHQWKSPLVAITALAQDLFYSFDTSQKEEESYHLNNIMIQVQYMTNTINDFQDFIIPSKKKTQFNVHHTISSMLNIVKHNIKYNYVNINIHVKEGTKLTVYGYENEFMQAILNIINNAKDALLHNNEKNRNININLRNRDENTLLIDIIDNGPGIKKETVDKIFLQYFSTKEKGHGIGLYMTKLIIEDKLGGKIQYKHVDEGSCFRIKLKYE
jgi:PAS domain S-box-containing protein